MLSSRSTAVVVLLAGLALAAGAAAQVPPAAPAPAPGPALDVQVITAEAVHAIVLPMKGSYAQHPDAFGRLGGFIAGRGITPTGSPFARYFSDPSVGEANLEWEVGFPVGADVAAEAPFEIRDLPATLTAVHLHKGPMEELGTAWPAFLEWIASNGYQPSGAPSQVFKGDMMTAPEVEMRMPVQK